MSVSTLTELFLRAAEHDKPDCLLVKRGGRYEPISTAQLVDEVRRLAHALRGLGVERGDRVALMAENGPHWPAIDFAALCAGAILVPIYPTLRPEDAAFITRDSGAKVVFAQGRERLEGLLAQRASLPAVAHFVLIEEAGADAGTQAGTGGSQSPVGSLERSVPFGSGEPHRETYAWALARGEGADHDSFVAEARRARPEDLATFIYTSGTTGNPKGVMLTHGNIASNVVDALKRLDIEGWYTALSFLPLSHSFERTVDYIYFYKGVTIAYAESINTIAQNLGEVKPHVFVSVPRVYEKVQARILDNVRQGSGLKQKIFHWALRVGARSVPYRVREERPPGLLGLQVALADRLVFGKIRERLGGRFAFAISGGAPLGRELAEFFWGAGIRIFEGFGLTETSPVLTVNSPGSTRLGTVGQAIPNVELRIAEDGEVLARGPNIMQGYYGKPEATAEVIDADGWFHTGDIGRIDEDGFLAITDRKKELIVTSGGKNIAPAPIENKLKSSRWIAQAVVIGDQRNFISALVVPDFEALRGWARGAGISFASDAELVASPHARELLAGEIATVNRDLTRHEQIKTWELLPAELTLEGGELTPTQKVKRRVVHQKYADVIERLYSGAGRE